MKNKQQIIAEVKTASPFDGVLARGTWEERFVIAQEIGDIISVHTDPRWGGSMELLSQARKLTEKLILAKGLHETDDEIKEALARGADKVLVVGRLPEIENDLYGKLLIEPYTLRELEEYVKAYPNGNYVWNSRDLRDGSVKDPKMFSEARAIVREGTLCQASNIETIDDVFPCADSVLVGTYLKEFRDSLVNRL